ncbi:MAG: site-2 protease family protein [Clostridia bacterium]|nr:site-2 protease family protein [Clostridia bacterium]
MSVTLGSCRIRISYYFFAMLAALCIADGGGIIICGIVAASIHELGHLAAMLIFSHAAPEVVDITPFGLRISLRGGVFLRRWMLVAIAGAVANMLCCALFGCLCTLWYSPFLIRLAAANLCLAIVNLFPVEPLDGGQLIRAMLDRVLSCEQAERASFIISVLFLLPLATAGLYVLIRSQGNFSLLLLSLWLLLSIIRKYI